MNQEENTEESDIQEESNGLDRKKNLFELNEIIFMAIIAAIVTVANFFTVPIVLAIPLVGIRQVACAFPQGLLFTIALLKVKKPGSILFLAFLTGIVLLPISWVIFAFNMFAGILSELILLIFFRDYKKKITIVIGCSIYNPLTIPGAYIAQLWAGESIAIYINNPPVTVFMFILAFIVSLLGCLAGLKIGKSLKKAGKLS